MPNYGCMHLQTPTAQTILENVHVGIKTKFKDLMTTLVGCVCVCEREREREGEGGGREGGREGERERL